MSPQLGRPVQQRGVATRARLLASATELMRRRGYHATGLNDVVAHSRAPKGSLYHYFPRGKEQLAGEAVTESARIVAEHIRVLLEASPDLGAAIRAFAELLVVNLKQSDFREGCPVAAVSLDAASDSDVIRESCAAGLLSWRDTIADELRRRGRPPGDATRLATLVLSAFEGAVLMARATRDAQPLLDVAELLAAHLRSPSAR